MGGFVSSVVRAVTAVATGGISEAAGVFKKPKVPGAPGVGATPEEVKKKDIQKGAGEITKRRAGAVGQKERRAPSKSILSSSLENTLLGD